ncbi:MAG TPA: hypothetical protein VLJ80_00575 [Solirubrobacteraceae bacterium]|nr:hypothetical protein [Solirubrobacteraceae bacterium]
MTGSGKNDSKTAPTRKPGKAARASKPARSRTAKSSSSSGKARAARKAASSAKAMTTRSGGASRNAAASPGKTASSSGKPERLSAGGLDPLVLDYLKKNKATAPHGPSQVAKALGRSSGAIGNCLVRLTDAKKAKQVKDKPLRYDLAS